MNFFVPGHGAASGLSLRRTLVRSVTLFGKTKSYTTDTDEHRKVIRIIRTIREKKIAAPLRSFFLCG
jgi:hypothetical protein